MKLPGVLIVALWSSSAWAQVSTTTCSSASGTVGVLGQCNGDLLERCDSDGNLVQEDCTLGGPAFGCGLADCTDPLRCEGYSCVARIGAVCTSSLTIHLSCDAALTEGCIGGSCQVSSACDPSTYAGSCSGPRLSFCDGGAVSSVDCSRGGSLPYTCGTLSSGAPSCVAMEGGFCQPPLSPACVSGVDCQDDICVSPFPAATACSSIPTLGECQGDTVRFCEGGEVVSFDCATEVGSFSTCGVLDCIDNPAACAGRFCVAKAGADCSGLPCDVSQGLGCIGGTCQPSPACDPQSFVSSCLGTVLSYCAYTVADFDCSQGGMVPQTCGPNAAGEAACVGLPGGACDLARNFGCAAGLACVGGVCVVANTPDGGGLDVSTSTAADGLLSGDGSLTDGPSDDAAGSDASATLDAGAALDAALSSDAGAGLDSGRILDAAGSAADASSLIDAGASSAPTGGCACQGSASSDRSPAAWGLAAVFAIGVALRRRSARKGAAL